MTIRNRLEVSAKKLVFNKKFGVNTIQQMMHEVPETSMELAEKIYRETVERYCWKR